MFGIFKRKRKNDDVAYAHKRFDELKAIVDEAPPQGKLALSIILASEWKCFLRKFKTPSLFLNQPQDVKFSYFEKRARFQESLAKDGQSIELLSCDLFNMYILSLVAGDSSLETKTIGCIEPLTQQGWALV